MLPDLSVPLGFSDDITTLVRSLNVTILMAAVGFASHALIRHHGLAEAGRTTSRASTYTTMIVGVIAVLIPIAYFNIVDLQRPLTLSGLIVQTGSLITAIGFWRVDNELRHVEAKVIHQAIVSDFGELVDVLDTRRHAAKNRLLRIAAYVFLVIVAVILFARQEQTINSVERETSRATAALCVQSNEERAGIRRFIAEFDDAELTDRAERTFADVPCPPEL